MIMLLLMSLSTTSTSVTAIELLPGSETSTVTLIVEWGRIFVSALGNWIVVVGAMRSMVTGRGLVSSLPAYSLTEMVIVCSPSCKIPLTFQLTRNEFCGSRVVPVLLGMSWLLTSAGCSFKWQWRS